MRRYLLKTILMILPVITAFAGNPGLQVVNASGDPIMTLVRVELNDSILADTVIFNDATSYMEVPAGDGQTLKYTSIFNSSIILELTDLNLEEDKLYQSILYGVDDDADFFPNPEGQSIQLDATFVEVDSSGIADDDVRVNFFHSVSDMVEVDIADLIFEFIVNDINFGEYSTASTDLPADMRSIFVTTTDSILVIASRSIDLSAIEGNTITIFLSGFIVPVDNNNGPTFGVYGVDQAGNIYELGFVLASPLDELLTDLNVYPNPATDRISVDFFHGGNDNLQLFITDLSGRTMMRQSLPVYPGNNQQTFELSEMVNGLYLLILSNGRENKSIPFVIQR